MWPSREPDLLSSNLLGVPSGNNKGKQKKKNTLQKERNSTALKIFGGQWQNREMYTTLPVFKGQNHQRWMLLGHRYHLDALKNFLTGKIVLLWDE